MKKLEPTKKLVTKDGTVMHYWNGKLHCWEGAALIPQGNLKKAEYYLFGIKHTKDKWMEAKRDTIGVPPCKKPIYKASTPDN